MRPTSLYLHRIANATRPWRWLLALLVVAVALLALTPAPPVELGVGWDKLNHVLAFTALALCAALGYRTPRALQLVMLAALLGFGGLIEVLQQYVPNRSAEWGDLRADAIGIGIGALVAACVLRRQRPRPPAAAARLARGERDQERHEAEDAAHVVKAAPLLEQVGYPAGFRRERGIQETGVHGRDANQREAEDGEEQ